MNKLFWAVVTVIAFITFYTFINAPKHAIDVNYKRIEKGLKEVVNE